MALNWDKIQGRTSSTIQNNNTYQSTIDWDKVQGRTNNTISKSIDFSKTPAYNLLKTNTSISARDASQTLNNASRTQSYNAADSINNGSNNIVPLNTKAYTNNTSKLKAGNITLPSSLTNTSSTVKNNLRNNLEEKAKKNNQDIVSTLLKEKKEKEAKALEEERIKKAQDELNARETVQKLNKNLGAMNSLNDIKGGSRIERTLAEREMKRKAGIYVPNEPLVTPVGLAEAGSSPIELVNAGRMAEAELNKTINEQKENNNYENYMGEEYSKLNQYKNNYNEAMKGTDINELARTNALMSNAEFGKEVVDLSKYYDAWTSQANYIAGNLGIRYNEAMAKYFETQNIADLNEAERIEELMVLYNQKAENVGKGGIIRKDFANYAPQLVGQTVEGAKGAAMGASAGALTGAAIGSVVPGAGTMAGATTGAVWGARGGYVAGVGKFSYTQMIGSAYSQLLDLGIPNDIAKEVASNTALWQSVIEMTGSAIDLVSLGLGSKAVKGVAGKTVGQLTAKKLIVEALKAYGINLASETAEEAIQEKIAIEGEKVAFDKAGMQRTTTEQEDLQRIIEAGAGGFTIALVSGGGNVIGSITTTALNSNTKMKVNKIYNEQINIIKGSNLTEAQKQSKIIELEDGRKNTINAIDKQIQETEGQKKVDLKNVAPEVNTIQMANKNNEIINLQKNSNIIQNASNNENISQNNIQQSLGTEQVRNAEVTREIQTFVNNRNKISPGLSVEMDSTLNTDGIIEKRADGTRTMKINPNSSRAYEFVAVHEMLHDLEGAKEQYQDLSSFVKKRAMTHEDFETAKSNLTEQYTKYYQENGLDMSNLNMENETVNDMVARALGNQDFLNELAGNKPNVFMRMYNWIKNVLLDGQNTGKTFSERRVQNKYLQELKNKFEIAYNTAYNNSNSQTKYSIAGQKGLQNAINNDARFQRLENNLMKAQQMAQNGIDNEYIRQNTNWFQDKNGDWKFEFSDKDMSLKKGVTLEENKTYKLGDILEHDILFLMYPELIDYKVTYQDLGENKKATFVRRNNEIRINSNLKRQQHIESTLIHEIQHAIQKIEGFERGRSSKGSKLAYYNSLGEIEADNTKNRYIEEKQGNLNRDIIPPESSKFNPKHSKLDNYLNNRTIFDKIKDGIYKYLEDRGIIDDSISKEFDTHDFNRSRSMVVRGGYIDDSISKQNNQENSRKNIQPDKQTDDVGGRIEGLEKSSSFSFNTIRNDIANADLNAEAKPHGLYVSNLFETDKNTFTYPFKDGELNTTYEIKVTPRNPLEVEKFYMKTSRAKEEILVDVGVSALKKLVANEEFDRINTLSKEQLIKELENKYPGYDYTKYYDKLELLAAYGAQLARDKGYDAIVAKKSTNSIKEIQDIENEISILKNNIMSIKNNNAENSNKSSFSLPKNSNLKELQLAIIEKYNPMQDDYHTGIRSIDDIKTFDEVINDDESFVWGDFSQEDAKKALEKGKITVYSSKPIEQGGFVSTSKNQASDYAANGKIYSKEVNLNDVAWINGDEGQYAKVDDISFSQFNDKWQSYLDKNWDLMPNAKKTFGSTTLEEMQENSLDSDNKSGATVTTKKYEVSKINSFMDKVLAKMETTRFGNTKELKNITKAIVKDIKNNTLTNEKAKQYLNVIYDATIRIDSQFYEENKAIKDTIRNTKLYVSPETRNGMTDWQDFRKSNFGILSLSEDKNNLGIDTFYKELSSERADLFPKTITNQIDQLERISEVAKSIRKIEQKASEYLENNYGKEIREATIEEMQKDMNELVQEINQVQKVEAENLEKMTEKSELLETGKNLTVEQIKELQKENTKLKREYEKALRKELLTERDKLQLDRLVKGEITLDEINGQSNREAIKRLYEFKKPLEDNNNKILQAKKAKKAVRFAMAEEAVKNSGNWKDKKLLGGLRYSTETAERIIYDIVKNEAEAKNVIDTYFTPVHEHEAQATRKKNEIVDRIKKLNISAKESYEVSESIREKINKQLPKGEVYKETKLSESSLVQLLGEKIIDTKDIQELGADVSKIENATNVFREVYNELFELSNDALIANGYPPVEYRKDYFPHFTEEKPDTVVKKILSKFGVETSNQELPTDLAGLTHTFKPGKKWVGNFLERKSTITDYNALKGLDTYLEPVMDVIYHTDDIQNLRALEDTIRYKYSKKGIQEQIDNTRDRLDLDDIQKNAILNDLYNTDTTDFSHFVTWLRGYTDNLSGKKSIEDRNMEHKLGRAAYNTMKNVEGKVASNMIGANINSALTNFIPLAQGWGEVSTGSMAKAMWDTARNASKSDNFVENSDFLINRRGNDRLYKDWKINLSEKAGKPMSVIDEFTSETLVRAKYYDNIKAGMTQEDAMANANTFAASVMGDRSKGATPTIFNEKNPITKTFTMFQLEVNNQYRYWLKDLPRNVRDEVGNSLAKALFKIFLGSWLYGEIKEKLTGTRSITDPIDMIVDTFKDVLDEDVGAGQSIMNLGNRIVDELPFISTLTGGGRIPISAAFPDLENTIKATTGLATGEMDTRKATRILLKELSKPAYYLLLPTAGGQIKKTIEGISTVANGGEYGFDSEGNKTLKFPVDTKNMNTLEKIGTYAKAATFGKYSLPTARDYIDNGNKQLSAKKTQGYEEAIKKGITAKQYLDINQQIGKIKPDNGEKFVTNERRTKIINIIESQDLTKEQKEYLYKVFYKNEI